MVRSPHGFLIASIADRLSDGPFHITPVLCELIGGELRHRVYYTLLKFGASVLTLGRGKCCGFFVNFLYQEKEFVCRFQQRLRVQCGKAVTRMAFMVKNMEETDHWTWTLC